MNSDSTDQQLKGWSLADIGDLSGQTIVVTGANSGLGFTVAEECSARGASVVLAVRSQAKGAEAARRISAASPAGDVEVVELDLSDLSSVETCAVGLVERVGGIDVLINNAGVMAPPRQETADGFELQFGTNHLGHFAFTGRVFPLLTGASGRVVSLSSLAARQGRLDFDDLSMERSYDRWEAYQQSKLANLMFGRELARRATEADSDLTSTIAHPGIASTNLGSSLVSTPNSASLTSRLAQIKAAAQSMMFRAAGQSVERGALPVFAAAFGPVSSGDYLGPSGPGETRGKTVQLARVPDAATSAPDARRLWEVSEELTGVSFLS